jgi:hypothetical protein
LRGARILRLCMTRSHAPLGGSKKAPLALYDISRRIGAYLGKSPRVVYLHPDAAEGARHLGLSGTTLNKKPLPPAFPD